MRQGFPCFFAKRFSRKGIEKQAQRQVFRNIYFDYGTVNIEIYLVRFYFRMRGQFV